MSQFREAVLTTQGSALIAKLQAGATTHFTKIAVSAQNLSSLTTEQLSNLTSLSSIKKELSPDVSVTGSNSVNVSASYSNNDVTEEYKINSVGLYAMDPDLGEILYYVLVDDVPDLVPKYSEFTSSGVIFNIDVYVGNVDGVIIQIGTATGATIEELNALSTVVNNHINTTILEEGGAHGIRYTIDEEGLGKLYYRDSEGNWKSIDFVDTLSKVGDDTKEGNLTIKGSLISTEPLKTGGQNYAEMFQWADGNPRGENRMNRFVSIKLGTNMIELAGPDTNTLGVTSNTASIIGNYSKENEESTSFELVGMLGVLTVVDDGTCVVGGYCVSGENGIATAFENGYLVLKRIDDNTVVITMDTDSDKIAKLQDDVKNMAVHELLIVVETTDWTGSEFPYTATVEHNLGFEPGQKPDVDIDLSSCSSQEELESLEAAWANVYRVAFDATNMTLYSKEVPTVALKVAVKAVK